MVTDNFHLLQIKRFILILMIGFPCLSHSQNNEIEIRATLIGDHKMMIDQVIRYYNPSEAPMDTIYLLNWANGYRDKKTPLTKRLLEDYNKSLYFANIKDRGYSRIIQMESRGKPIIFQELKGASDIVKVTLPQRLAPHEAIELHLVYEISIPIDKFTRYGRDEIGYHLRYWQITPAVFDEHWNLFSNLNMDDYYVQPTDYSIIFSIPLGYTLSSDLLQDVSLEDDHVSYKLSGKNRLDLEIDIGFQKGFSVYTTDGPNILTDLTSKNLTENIKEDVLQRQLDFINTRLGAFPHSKMLISKATYQKRPVYGFNQLPKKLNPFSDVFEWDIKMFKAITHQYIEKTILTNPRNDAWFADGIQIYLMMEYVNAFYPEVKAIGKIAKKWGINRYSIAKLDFNGKYPFVYQFSTRKQLDQALTTRSDSLSNFNLKLVNRYKAGLGLRYLDKYIDHGILTSSLREFYKTNLLQLSKSSEFGQILKSKTNKNLDWFFGDYLTTNNKINYTIKKIKKDRDSVRLIIENRSNFPAPITLYGVDKKEIVYKKWIEPIDTALAMTITSKGIDRVSLNYDYLYPEANFRDNWKKLDTKIFHRPLKVTFFRDIEDPYYNQVFYKPIIDYNFYDGLLLGPTIYNQALFKKKWLFTATPLYGFKSNTLTGGFSMAYEHLPQEGSIYRYRAGFAASRSHYDNDLAFNKLSPILRIDFKRKSLRDVGGRSLLARYVLVDKDVPKGIEIDESYKYDIINVRYGYFKPEIINDLRYFADFQYHPDFSKVSLDIRYRKLTNINRYIDFRMFFGAFLSNNTESDFFSYSIDRPSDYLFDLNYLGRSEDTGFLSQQVIITEGGFKSIFEDPYADEWILTTNASMSIWRWIELYADAGFLKSQGTDARFKYDTGVRLNFIHNFLEFYFPLQSSNGFEPEMSDYASRIRFVLTIDIERVYNFVKRGFY